jgi:hypothetical protein
LSVKRGASSSEQGCNKLQHILQGQAEAPDVKERIKETTTKPIEVATFKRQLIASPVRIHSSRLPEV